MPHNFGHTDIGFSDPSDFYANGKKLFIEFEYFHAVEEVNKVIFKAFLTEYNDKFTSNWNEEKVYGRIDPIYTFQETNRQISLAWDVPSSGLQEARDNMAKASRLMRFLYPTYGTNGDATTIVKPPLLRMRFVNLAKKDFSKGLLGKVDGFTFSPDMEIGWWDGDRTIASGMTNLLYPKTLKFSCTFSVIHEQPLGWNQNGAWEIIKEQKGAEGLTEFDYSKNSFPFMPIKISANDTLGLKTPVQYEESIEAILNEETPEEVVARLDPLTAQESDGSSTSLEYDADVSILDPVDDWVPAPTSESPEYEEENLEENLLGDVFGPQSI